jgi:hypothetical protein
MKSELRSETALLLAALSFSSSPVMPAQQGSAAPPQLSVPLRVRVELPEPTLYRDAQTFETGMLLQDHCDAGCARMNLQLKTKLDNTYVSFSDGTKSYWVSGIEVLLSYDSIDVYVNPRYESGTCEYRLVLEHEMDHVRADQKLVEEYAQRMESGLLSVAWPTYANPAMANSFAESRAQARAKLIGVVESLFEELENHRHQASEEVDASQQPSRLQETCSLR